MCIVCCLVATWFRVTVLWLQLGRYRVIFRGMDVCQTCHVCFKLTMPVGRKLWRGVRLAKRVATTAGGLGAAQGPQKLWGIWCKILHSSNLETPYFSLKNVGFFSLLISLFPIISSLKTSFFAFFFQCKWCILSNFLADFVLILPINCVAVDWRHISGTRRFL